MNMKRHLAVAVALSVSLGIASSITTPLSPTKVEAAEINVNQDQQQALDYVNYMRKGVGLSPVKINTILSQAAQGHADYLANVTRNATHDQREGNPGFTGKTHSERLAKLGYMPSGTSEYIIWSSTDVREAIDEMTSGTNHRFSFIDPATIEIGVGHAGKATVVLFQASKTTVVNSGGVYHLKVNKT